MRHVGDLRAARRQAVGLMAATLFLGACATPQKGGVFKRTPNLDWDRTFLSPPIIDEPLLRCGTSVTVYGYVPEAFVEVFANGALIGSVVTGMGLRPDRETINVNPSLGMGQTVTAQQTFEGATSDPSEPVIVKDHTEVYPSGLPQPNFPALHLYDCGIATVLDQLPQGGELRVFAADPAPGSTPSLVGQRKGVDQRQVLGIGPAFNVGDVVTAESQICDVVSRASERHEVQPAPTLPTPEISDMWDGGKWLSAHSLVNGTRVTITNAGTTIGGGGAPSGHVRFRLDPPVSAGDPPEVVQELCGVESPPGTTTVRPCSEFPPVRMRAPRAGDSEIRLIDPVDGARIRIFASGQEIGDGGGSVVQLDRPLVEGEVVIAVQSLDGCIASTSHVVTVGEGLEDPSQAGLCGQVKRWEYGHAGDRDRRTTDVASYFNSPDPSVTTPMNAVPLHGVVRFPDGPGPFPLVLIVHGNHSPLEFSYPGYDYLLDLLASHCMIAVSVEEDFLNGWVSGEMDARAIVLLRHLQLWREWNQTPGHRFFTKVDMSHVGLAGHSRGGEAVLVAEHFNTSLDNPADPEHDFGLGIRGCYAIAPVDGQIEGSPITMRGADYFVMHGTHDGDVQSFPGHKAYDRAHPVTQATDDFKGLLWVYGADHSQWNTVWAPSGDPYEITPTSHKISAADQRQLGKAFLVAFFLSSLNGWHEYNDLVAAEVTFSSLPGSVTRVTQYQDPTRLFLNHYEEDDDEATGSPPTGVTNHVEGTLSPYQDIPFDDHGAPHFLWQQTDGLVLGWDGSDERRLVVELTADETDVLAGFRRLAFRTGQTHDETSPPKNPAGINKDFRVQLRFVGGQGPSVRVSDYVRLPYPEEVGNTWAGTKTVMQTVRIPWKDLYGSSFNLGRDRPRAIVFLFEEQGTGLVVIDEIQFTD